MVQLKNDNKRLMNENASLRWQIEDLQEKLREAKTSTNDTRSEYIFFLILYVDPSPFIDSK